MADDSLRTSGGAEAIRTVDRTTAKTQVALLDVAGAGEDERLGMPPAGVLSDTSAGLTTSVTAYTSGDQVGTEFTWLLAARDSGLGLAVVSVTMIDLANVLGTCDLLLFPETVTPAADNAANAFSDADMAKCLGVVTIPTPVASANNRVATASAGVHAGLPIILAPTVTTLFGHLVTRTANSFFSAVGDVILKLGVRKD